jgi:hypothetical protein
MLYALCSIAVSVFVPAGKPFGSATNDPLTFAAVVKKAPQQGLLGAVKPQLNLDKIHLTVHLCQAESSTQEQR